jgi:ABC-type multidrug transport system fused ATPase/permease subunit
VGVWFLFDPFIDYITRKYTIDIAKKVSMKWKREAWLRYYNASYDDRMETQPEQLNQMLDRSCWAIFDIIDWGLFSSIGVLSSVFSTLYIFWSNDMMTHAFLAIVVNIVSYHLFAKKKMKEYFLERNKIRDQRDELECEKSMLLPQLQYRQPVLDSINALEEHMENRRVHSMGSWRNITFYTNVTNGVIIMVIFFLENELDIVQFFLILGALQSFSGSLNSSMNFMNRFSQLDDGFRSLEETLDKFNLDEDEEKLDFDGPIQIPAQVFSPKEFQITVPTLEFEPGSRILIKGASGSGKSTFVNSLMGKYSGMIFSDQMLGGPRNYQHHFVVLTTKTTVRKIFGKESDDDTIYKYCRITGVEDWARGLKPKKKREKKYPDWTIVSVLFDVVYGWVSTKFRSRNRKDDHPKKTDDHQVSDIEAAHNSEEVEPVFNPLDVEIFERHSGGEKSRFVLSKILYELKKGGKKILILDEPEQGCDPPMAYDIIERIHREFPEVTIIIISHLERIQEKDWWDLTLHVDNGDVQKIATG